MTHLEDLLRLRNLETDTLRNKVEELEAKLEVLNAQIEQDAKNK